MAQALEPYLDWLRVTAQQCQQVATSMQAMTTAFELTHWTVVHPSVVAANRARLAMLLATNFFGINYPAIAETEAEYHAMWVNNAAAIVPLRRDLGERRPAAGLRHRRRRLPIRRA